MNHDYAHCANYNSEECPLECFRAQLVEDYRKRADMKGVPVSWMYLRETDSCPLNNKPKPTHADKIRAMTDEELANFLCDLCGMCAGCIAADFCKYGKIGFVEWLKQEVQSDT